MNTQVVDSEQTIWGVPGRWAPLAAGESGLKVIAEAADGIHVDGVLVDGEAVVRGKDDPNPVATSSSARPLRGFVIAQQGGGYALRVWDAESEGIQNFGGIDAFPYDPAWVITAAWSDNPEGTTMGFEHLKDEGHTREEVVPGRITFSHDGADYDIAAFKSGRALQLVFADATNGDSTYSVGRFLYVAPNADGTITLDFNRAVIPPCAFSYAFNCPLPPKQNRFPFAVEAGEKNALAADGSLLHPRARDAARLHPAPPVRRRLGRDPRPPPARGHRYADRVPRDARAGARRRRGGLAGARPPQPARCEGRVGSRLDAGRRDRSRTAAGSAAWCASSRRARPATSPNRGREPRRANLVGVFVDPEWRGDAGVTDALLGEVARWAAEEKGLTAAPPARQRPQPAGDPLVREARFRARPARSTRCPSDPDDREIEMVAACPRR